MSFTHFMQAFLTSLALNFVAMIVAFALVFGSIWLVREFMLDHQRKHASKDTEARQKADQLTAPPEHGQITERP